MSLFQKAVLNKYLKSADQNILKEKYKLFSDHFLNSTIQENIRNSKEEQYQEGFLNDLFVNILGYTKNPIPNFNLTTELKNVKDSKKVDGAILISSKTKAVIELKGMNTTDLSSIETQAFGYKNNHPECTYVITSNFQKVRFYIDNAIEYLEFDLFNLSFDDFQVLDLCLGVENVSKDIPKRIKDESLTEENDITKKLYKDYSLFKRELYENILQLNSTIDPLLLFKKTQKLIDRFLFLFFAEDRGLLQPNSVRTIVDRWQTLRDLDAYSPLIDNYRKYFGYLNTGYTSNDLIVFAYNGGLFAPDEILDQIDIDDELLKKHTLKMAKYDFASEVDVNILGHIFENSLNELEEVQAEIKGELVEKTKTKRKKDGVFYTPKYITKYIVENTIGKLCNDKKTELELIESDYHSEVSIKKLTKKQKEEKKYLLEKLEVYRNWLLQLTICDPACGSGAFLNQALDFLILEHRYIDELQANLFGDALILTDIEGNILENNLYGVDINEESIEIAKLSLWLRTAEPNRKLTTLSNNLKCGNSLIDDPAVAGEKAFNWEQEFPNVFAKGGFDIIIGNPPYGIIMTKTEYQYYSNHFPLTNYKINLYLLFIERILQVFKSGNVSFIIPKSLLFNSYYKFFREHLLKHVQINQIDTITEKVFQDAEVGGSLIIDFTIKDQIDLDKKFKLNESEKIINFISNTHNTTVYKTQNDYLNIPNYEISIIHENQNSILNKLLSLHKIGDFYKLRNGLNPGNIKHILVSDIARNNNYKPIIWGKDLTKYSIIWSNQFINYDDNISESISLSDIKSKPGMNKQTKIDFALRSPELFENEKILVRKTGDKLIASLDSDRYYFDTLIHGIYIDNSSYNLEFLLAILNSKPATVFYRILHDIKGKVFAKISLENLSNFPIPLINEDVKLTFKISVHKILGLNKDLQNMTTKFIKILTSELALAEPSKKLQEWYNLEFTDFVKELKKRKIELSLAQKSEWIDFFEIEKQKANAIQFEIETTEKQIDQMVYELYELTPEEIEIVKNN